MSTEKDYTHKVWLALLALIVVLVGVSLLPPSTIGGIPLRRANIFSDLFHYSDGPEPSTSQVVLNEEEFRVNMAAVTEQIVADTLPPTVQTTFTWRVGDAKSRYMLGPDSVRFANTARAGITLIEDFDTTGNSRMEALYTKLLKGGPVRIAVFGDSFIEGDILTADLRERMQGLYGGSGVGFAPMASPLTGFRRTVKTQSKGWSTHNIMQYRTTPQELRDHFYMSGWVCEPTTDAQTRWECSNTHKYLTPCAEARVLFISHANSRAEVTVNDTLRRSFAIEGDDALRQIEITGIPLRSLSFRVTEGAEGFIGYGALLEGGGVGVDNYSVRSNNGQAMFRTNPTINAQANDMLNYDLVVLQYGLNIMQQGIRNYANYSKQMEKMVAYVRQCFPTAAILVMGVSDRSVRTDNGIEPMDAVPYMIQYQRQVAVGSGAAFWDTAAAMRAMGGMKLFVANGWAGKDYTHINYAGGQRVADALAEALHEGVRQRAQIRKRELLFKQRNTGINDSLKLRVSDHLLTPVVIK